MIKKGVGTGMGAAVAAALLLAGCSNLPMKAELGTKVVRLSKITGNFAPSPVGGAHAESCQMVFINVESDPGSLPCVKMKQDGCSIDTCEAGGSEE